MARQNRKPTKGKKTPPRKDSPPPAAEQAQPKKRVLRKDQALPGTLKEQLTGIVGHLTPSLKNWINEGAEEESKLKAAKITLELMEFVQPKLTRVVLSEAEAGAIAKGVGAELRKQLAQRLLQEVQPSE